MYSGKYNFRAYFVPRGETKMKKHEFRFNKRALLSIILIICMVFGSMPVAASEIDTEGVSVAVSGSDLPAENTEVKSESKAEKTASPTDEPTNEPTIIDSVSIYELEKPAAGNNPDFRVTVSAGEDYSIDFSYGLGGVVWTDMSDGKELSSNDAFETGRRYRVDIYVKAYDEAAFKTSNGQPAADADIDGRIAAVKALPTVSADKLIIVSGTYSIADPNTTISAVEAIDLDMPVFGAKPDFDITIPANANFTVDSIKWTKDVSTESEYLTKELTENDTFDAGDYAVTVTFRAKDGYKFRANADGVITGRLNGDVAMPACSITDDGEYDTYSICLYPSVEEPASQYTAISAVEASDLTLPVFGEKPDFDLSVPADADYTIDSVKWEKDVSNENEYLTEELGANDTFTAGEYIVTVTFRANNGFKFKANANGVITGKINGDVAMPASSITNDGEYDIYSICLMPSVEEPVSQNIAISAVEASDITMPVFGEKPDFDATVPADANYTIDSIKWTKDVSTESEYLTKELTENDTFDAGDYAVTVTFRAKDGYKFRANADGVITGRLNGEVAMPMSSITNDGEYDTYSICLMPSVEEPEEETEYEMLEGKNGKWIREKGKKLRFRASGDFEKFVRVLVDGVVIDRRHYVASSGSTIIELNESYLDGLADGKHLLTVEFTDGEVSTNFYINETAGDSEVPKTGDNDYAVVCAALMFISFCSMIALAVYDRKKGKAGI